MSPFEHTSQLDSVYKNWVEIPCILPTFQNSLGGEAVEISNLLISKENNRGWLGKERQRTGKFEMGRSRFIG